MMHLWRRSRFTEDCIIMGDLRSPRRPNDVGWEDEMDCRTTLYSSGNLWRYRLRGLGMRQSGGCAEALLVGPFTAFLYIAEHDLCLQFLYFNSSIRVMYSIYISRSSLVRLARV